MQLIKDLISYKKINIEVADRVLKAVIRHTWYLNEVLIGLAFFDRTIDVETKRLMIQALERTGSAQIENRITINLKLIPQQQIYDFITENTKKFFDILFDNSIVSVLTDFLDLDPSEWYTDESYQKAEEIAQLLFVVNDVAERAVALAGTYNDKFTKNEEQKQLVFLVVEEHRKEFPNTIKSTIMDKFQ